MSAGNTAIRPADRRIRPPGTRRLSAVLSVGLIALIFVGVLWSLRRGPQAPSEIFQGIIYGCEELETTAEGSGLLHWVRVDLSAPGIELYITPVDPEAVAQGWEYRLRRIGSVM